METNVANLLQLTETGATVANPEKAKKNFQVAAKNIVSGDAGHVGGKSSDNTTRRIELEGKR